MQKKGIRTEGMDLGTVEEIREDKRKEETKEVKERTNEQRKSKKDRHKKRT